MLKYISECLIVFLPLYTVNQGVFWCVFYLISAIISYNQKQLLDIRTANTNVDWDEDFYFIESAAVDVLLIPDQAIVPRIQ